VHPQTDLLHLIRALDPTRRLPRRLHGGQEQPDQDSNDRNHDEQLDQRKRRPNGP
jgi:hypothetical protein